MSTQTIYTRVFASLTSDKKEISTKTLFYYKLAPFPLSFIGFTNINKQSSLATKLQSMQ